MKLKEYIAHLKKFDPELEVWYTTDEDVEYYPTSSKGGVHTLGFSGYGWVDMCWIDKKDIKKCEKMKVFVK
jgi:hypothetical protein